MCNGVPSVARACGPSATQYRTAECSYLIVVVPHSPPTGPHQRLLRRAVQHEQLDFEAARRLARGKSEGELARLDTHCAHRGAVQNTKEKDGNYARSSRGRTIAQQHTCAEHVDTQCKKQVWQATGNGAVQRELSRRTTCLHSC
jgi:hypothetical protein